MGGWRDGWVLGGWEDVLGFSGGGLRLGGAATNRAAAGDGGMIGGGGVTAGVWWVGWGARKLAVVKGARFWGWGCLGPDKQNNRAATGVGRMRWGVGGMAGV